MDMNNLIKDIHENAVAHGWWEEERPFYELIALVHSELSEALEEYRNGKGINEIYRKCKHCGREQVAEYTKCHSCDSEDVMKLEGVPIELADVIIRIFDIMGERGYKYDEILTGDPIYYASDFELAELLTECHKSLSSVYVWEGADEEETTRWLLDVVGMIEGFSVKNGIDICEAVKIKHEYNKTRPYKHGGKVI